MRKIIIPESVTEIGGEAFWGCEFTSIVIPEGVTEIPNGSKHKKTTIAMVINQIIVVPPLLLTVLLIAFAQ